MTPRRTTLWISTHRLDLRTLARSVQSSVLRYMQFGASWFHMSSFPRLAIWLILQGRPDQFFCLIAVVCSSWVPTNCGTSRRSIAYPEGNTRHAYVVAANQMASRLPDSKRCMYVDILHICTCNMRIDIHIHIHIYVPHISGMVPTLDQSTECEGPNLCP